MLHRNKTYESLKSLMAEPELFSAVDVKEADLRTGLGLALQLIEEQRELLDKMRKNLTNARQACKDLNVGLMRKAHVIEILKTHF